jgi:hypothetical protein
VFEYTLHLPTGKAVTLQLKPVEQVPIEVMRRHQADADAQTWDILEWGVAPLALFDQVPAVDVDDMMTAWQRHGGVTVGEFAASSSPSTSMVRRSKPTSFATVCG